MAAMRPVSLSRSEGRGYSFIRWLATRCELLPDRDVLRSAVPLWKVIVGIDADERTPPSHLLGGFFLRESIRTGKVCEISSPEPLALEPLIKLGDIFSITIEQQRRATLANAD